MCDVALRGCSFRVSGAAPYFSSFRAQDRVFSKAEKQGEVGRPAKVEQRMSKKGAGPGGRRFRTVPEVWVSTREERGSSADVAVVTSYLP